MNIETIVEPFESSLDKKFFHLEKISIAYRRIEIEHLFSQSVVADDWSLRK